MSQISYPKSVKAMTCKQLIINSFSILEGILFGVVDTIQFTCNGITDCKDGCELYFRKQMTGYVKFDELKKYLNKIGALNFSTKGENFVKLAKDLRNNVHIGKSEEIESENINYNIDFVQESLATIKEVTNALIQFIHNLGGIKAYFCLSNRFVK